MGTKLALDGRVLSRVLVIGGACLIASAAYAQDDFSAQLAASTRDSEGAQTRYVVDSRFPTWPSRELRYYYNPDNQPDAITTTAMVELIQNAARKWENLCNVRFTYLGLHTAVPNVDATFSTIDRLNVIGWQPLMGSKAGFDGYVSWWYSGAAPSLVDADMVLNTAAGDRLASNPRDLGALITHEMGHMLAIRHSDVQASVMYANPYNTYDFQSTLRGDDAEACASLYGASAQADANRVFNWAEQEYGAFFTPSGTTSADYLDYHFRYFSGTNSFLAVQNDVVLYLPAGGSLTPLASVRDLLGAAAAAGF